MRFSVCLFLFIWFGISANAQRSPKKLKAAGETYFAKNKYHEAYNFFTKYARLKTPDEKMRLKIGVSAYHINRLPEAIKYFESIIDNEKKPEVETFYALARAYHEKQDYKKAIVQYKRYLMNTKFDHPKRESVKDNILRCASGINLAYTEAYAVVENLGEKVNSRYDDLGPIISPNYDNKLYFSSAREDATGGLRDDKGYPENTYGHYSTDIYSTIIINGEWTATTPLPALINSARNEVLLDFNENGQVLYYQQGLDLQKGEILVDSFNADNNALFHQPLQSPMNPAFGDGTPYFFNDSILLYSANRKEGMGGMDLYITKMHNGVWSAPQNLGKEINTPYDEIHPFLAKDGRTLYFSSNHLNGLGGMDIYKVKYNDATQTWGKRENMAPPINSPGDDEYFRVSSNGLEAYFSSNRKTGLGEYDLYAAYFKNKLFEQNGNSIPLVFSMVPDYRRQQEGTEIVFESIDGKETKSYPTTANFPESEILKYEVAPIFYRDDNDVMNQSNTKQIGEVIKLMKEYPQLKLMLTSHSDGSDPVTFDLFFSIKRAEKIANYMTKNGIKASNIYLNGVGSSYPSALQETEQGPSQVGKKLNRRIDFTIFNSAGLPLQITEKGAGISTFLADDRGKGYNQAIKGLAYKVQIASLGQRYKGDALLSYADPLIELRYDSENYQYTVGLFQTYSSAEDLRKELEAREITDAYVVPYINGVRASRDDSRIYAAAYPDLLKFLSETSPE